MGEAGGYSIQEIRQFCEQAYGTQRLLITPYAYPTTFLALAQNATQTNTVSIAANADFVLLMVHHRAALTTAQTAASKVCPFVRCLITDTGSNEQYTNAAVDLETYSSNANLQNPLPYPRIISGRSSLTIQVTNFAPLAETYSTLDVVLEGVQVRTY